MLLLEDDDLAAEKFGRALRSRRFDLVTVSDADAALAPDRR